MALVKVCGVTTVSDARMCVDLGVDFVGLNFWSGSPRCVEEAAAAEIVEALADAATPVAVVVDVGLARVRQIRERTGIRWVQLHGEESPDEVGALLPCAFKAIRVFGRDAIAEAARYPGEHLLLDAGVPGQLGGTGEVLDWDLAAEIAKTRRLTLAGGLRPDNVAEAVTRVKPYRVDVASGVESAPGIKDPAKVRSFVQAAKGGVPSVEDLT